MAAKNIHGVLEHFAQRYRETSPLRKVAAAGSAAALLGGCAVPVIPASTSRPSIEAAASLNVSTTPNPCYNPGFTSPTPESHQKAISCIDMRKGKVVLFDLANLGKKKDTALAAQTERNIEVATGGKVHMQVEAIPANPKEMKILRSLEPPNGACVTPDGEANQLPAQILPLEMSQLQDEGASVGVDVLPLRRCDHVVGLDNQGTDSVLGNGRLVNTAMVFAGDLLPDLGAVASIATHEIGHGVLNQGDNGEIQEYIKVVVGFDTPDQIQMRFLDSHTKVINLGSDYFKNAQFRRYGPFNFMGDFTGSNENGAQVGYGDIPKYTTLQMAMLNWDQPDPKVAIIGQERTINTLEQVLDGQSNIVPLINSIVMPELHTDGVEEYQTNQAFTDLALIPVGTEEGGINELQAFVVDPSSNEVAYLGILKTLHGVSQTVNLNGQEVQFRVTPDGRGISFQSAPISPILAAAAY